MATNKQLFSIQKYLSSSAVDKFKLDRVFEVNKSKTPQLYNDIVNDVQFLENNGLFILIDGEDVKVKYANGWYRDWETDRKSTRLNSSHSAKSRMPSSA